MWQTIIIWAIIALSAFYIFRCFYRKWRIALSPDADGACMASDCCGCPSFDSCSSAPQHPHSPNNNDTL
jgi:hypothetical protein